MTSFYLKTRWQLWLTNCRMALDVYATLYIGFFLALLYFTISVTEISVYYGLFQILLYLIRYGLYRCRTRIDLWLYRRFL